MQVTNATGKHIRKSKVKSMKEPKTFLGSVIDLTLDFLYVCIEPRNEINYYILRLCINIVTNSNLFNLNSYQKLDFYISFIYNININIKRKSW